MAPRQTPTPADDPEDRSVDAAAIVDATLALGEAIGWDAVHLHQVAEALGVPLAAIARHFPDKDAIAEAWFDRADRALLRVAEEPDWPQRSPRQRLHGAIFAWLDALSAHRDLTRAMLGYKVQPEHLHLQLRGVTRVSRTVQWIREAACLPAVGLQREIEEVALTTLYLATFAFWLRDDSAGFERTGAFLDRSLAMAERSARALFPAARRWTP